MPIYTNQCIIKLHLVLQPYVLLFCKHKLASFLSQQQTTGLFKLQNYLTLKLVFQKAKYLDQGQKNSRPTKQLTL